METEIITAIIVATAAVVGASLGSFLTLLVQRDKEAREQDSKRIDMLEDEVLARIGLEKAAVDWIVALKNTGEKGVGVQRELRSQAEKRTGLRPKMSKNKLYR